MLRTTVANDSSQFRCDNPRAISARIDTLVLDANSMKLCTDETGHSRHNTIWNDDLVSGQITSLSGRAYHTFAVAVRGQRICSWLAEVFDCPYMNAARGPRLSSTSIHNVCLQWDGNLDWRGDIKVFAPAASVLLDSSSFLTSWSRDRAFDQSVDGSVRYPIPERYGLEQQDVTARSNAAVIVSWASYEQSGDRGFHLGKYSRMKSWVDRVVDIAGNDLVWRAGFQYGDRLDLAPTWARFLSEEKSN